MANILVSLIGEQNAPNVFLILDPAFAQIDRHLFVTTEQMEAKKRVEYLVEACRIPAANYEKLIVPADDLNGILERFRALALDTQTNNYFVHLSGGTKLMSIALTLFFRQPAFRSRQYYIPVGKSTCWQIYPEAEYREFDLQSGRNLRTYLRGYGNDMEQAQALLGSESYTQGLFEWFVREADKTHRETINALRRQQQRATRIALPIDEGLSTLLETIGFPMENPEALSAKEAEYLIGGWFEEWVYNGIQQVLALPDAAIGLQVKTQRFENEPDQTDREFDILFLYEQTLFIIECKTGLGGRDQAKEGLKKMLHRLAAMRRANLGINVKTAFLTLADNLRRQRVLHPDFTRLAEELDVCLLDRYDLLGPTDEWVQRIIRQV
ncbi:MAG: DUF1887 family protein [Phaeodactylibacter sp.]|nr:DUF1887 family protein [Phaeodactylibacter sp.]